MSLAHAILTAVFAIAIMIIAIELNMFIFSKSKKSPGGNLKKRNQEAPSGYLVIAKCEDGELYPFIDFETDPGNLSNGQVIALTVKVVDSYK